MFKVQPIGLSLITLPLVSFGIQLSSQMLTDFPFPTFYSIPLATTFLAVIQIFHSLESFPFNWTWERSWLGKYLPFSTLDIKSPGSCKSFHTCLANSVSLAALRSLKLSSLADLLSVILSQLAQWIFLFSPCPPYQLVAILLLICLHKELDS